MAQPQYKFFFDFEKFSTDLLLYAHLTAEHNIDWSKK